MSHSTIAGRFIKFEFANSSPGFPPVEFEIITGSVSDTVAHETYLPVGRKVNNVVTHGRTVMYTFQGALLAGGMPWNTYTPITLGVISNALTPGTALTNLYVTLNTGGTSTDDSFFDEMYHYSAYAQVLSMEHAFDTSTHQIWNVQIMADGHYEEPNDYSQFYGG